MRFVDVNQPALYVLLINQSDLRLIEKWKSAVKYNFWDVITIYGGIHLME